MIIIVIIIFIIIIIIIKIGRQCKNEREWYINPMTPATQYQPIERKKRKANKVVK